MKFLQTLAVMSLPLMFSHFCTAQSLRIESKNGRTALLDLNSVESLVFDGSNVRLNTGDCGDNYVNVAFTQNLSFREFTTSVEVAEVPVESMLIYPNPASTSLTIDKMASNHIDARIIDVNGHVVRYVKLENQQSTVDISDMPGGLYFILADNESKKFIKL